MTTIDHAAAVAKLGEVLFRGNDGLGEVRIDADLANKLAALAAVADKLNGEGK